jgi:hypothetical protein
MADGKADLRGMLAVVAGPSRGAGRAGVAGGAGRGGATLYVTGRTARDGPASVAGAPGSIEATADEVGARRG